MLSIGSTVLGLMALASPPGEGVGALQVLAEKGVVAEVDAVKAARAQDAHGVIIRDLAPGPHRLKVVKRGAQPQYTIVSISAGQVTVWAPQPWQRTVSRRRDSSRRATETTKPTGGLLIQTLPVDAIITARTLNWVAPEHTKRAEPILVAAPVGLHRLSVCNDDVCVDYDVEVTANTLASIFVDLDHGEVLDYSAAHLAQWRRQRARCIETGRDCMTACNWDLALASPNAAPWTVSDSCRRLGPRAPPKTRVRDKAYPGLTQPGLTRPGLRPPGR